MATPSQQGLLSRLRNAISPAKEEKRSFDPTMFFPWTPTKAGVIISEDGAMAVSAVYACVHKIASTIASLNIELFQREAGVKERVMVHPAYHACSKEPNAYYTAFQFWQYIISDALLHGAGYALIERDQNGRPKSLNLMNPTQVKATQLNGRRIYIDERTEEPMYNEDILAIEAFRGISPIREHIENIGLAYAAQSYGSSFFGSGGNMSGVLMTDKILSEDQYRRLSTTWDQKYHGLNSAHATAILEAGLKYERVGIPPETAQALQTRKYQVEEICRIFNVPPSLVQMSTDVKYSNQEQQDLFFAKHTISPWLTNIEQELNRKMLLPAEKTKHFFKFDILGLMRGDMAARANYYHTLLSDGVLSINEVRELEDRNAVQNGDLHLCQVNQIPLESMLEYAKQITGQNTNGDAQ